MNPWRRRRVLVTGAAGFIGANLIESLASAGADVRALVRASTNCWRLDALPLHGARVVADLTDRQAASEAIRAVRPDVVFHLAAPSGHFETPQELDRALSDSQAAITNLYETVADFDVHRVIHFGSSLEYGPAAEPLVETRELAPTTGRGVVKAAETRWALAFARQSGLPLVMLRPFSVYGPWEGVHRFVPTVMRAILDDHVLRLTPPGIRRDFVFVRDVVAASLAAALTPGIEGEIFNVGAGRHYANEELVSAAEAVSGRKIRTWLGAYRTRPVDTGHWVADVEKARERLGWSAAHDLRSGLAETYRWFALQRTAASNVMGGVQ